MPFFCHAVRVHVPFLYMRVRPRFMAGQSSSMYKKWTNFPVESLTPPKTGTPGGSLLDTASMPPLPLSTTVILVLELPSYPISNQSNSALESSRIWAQTVVLGIKRQELLVVSPHTYHQRQQEIEKTREQWFCVFNPLTFRDGWEYVDAARSFHPSTSWICLHRTGNHWNFRHFDFLLFLVCLLRINGMRSNVNPI